MAELKEILQDLVNKDFDDLVELAAGAHERLIRALMDKGANDDQITTYLISTIKFFVSADKECKYAERDLINKSFDLDLTAEEFFDMTNCGSDPSFKETYFKVTKSGGEEIGIAAYILGAIILASDETISVDEQDALKEFEEKAF